MIDKTKNHFHITNRFCYPCQINEIRANIKEVCYKTDQLRVDLENRYPSVVTNRRNRKPIRADLSVIDKALTDLEELSSTLFYAGRVNDGDNR